MINEPPPGGHRPLMLLVEGGEEILGWRAFDSRTGVFRYWRWGRPSYRKSDSAWEKRGVSEVKNVGGWRALEPPKVVADPICRAEAEVILRRGLLTDGFRDKAELRRNRGVRSALEPDAEDDRQWTEAFERHNLFGKWMPEPFDHDNYLIAMSWYVKLGHVVDGHRYQKVVRWRALGFSFQAIGDTFLYLSREGARGVYNQAIDEVWKWARAHAADKHADPIRRLPSRLWNTGASAEAG